MMEIVQSAAVLGFLERVMAKALASADNKVRHQATQAEADALAAKQAKRPRAIKTSEQRGAEARKAQEKAALARAAKVAATKPPKKVAAASRRAAKTAAETLGKQFNLSPDQVSAIRDILAQAGQGGAA